ncbi:MAG: NAD-dependent epimerase/dehydratase family protein [Desulfobacterales bacterium]
MTRNDGEPVLVTGPGGFLGSALVSALVARGRRVRGFSRSAPPGLSRLPIEFLQGDLADLEAVDRACRGVAVVFHTAAKPPPWGRRRDYVRTNVIGTRNVIAACRRHGVRRLIHTSSPSVVFTGGDLEGVDESAPYPPRYNADYPATKAEAERAVIAAGKEGALRTIVLRPHQIWGPGDPHFVPRLLRRARRLRRIGEGKNLVDTTFIEDAAEAHLLADRALAENAALSGRVFFISQGEPLPAWEMIDRILNAAGLPPVRGAMSLAAARRLGWICEWLWRGLALPGEPPLTRFVAEALGTAHWFDISAARRDLGYRPRVSVAQGLERLARSLNSAGGGLR